MTNQTIDNGVGDSLGRAILWQYDKADNLVNICKSLQSFFDNSTKSLWDKYQTEINVDDATDYGLSLLGSLIGCYRPDGISTELFRKFVKAKFRLAMSDFSVYDINEYLYSIFGDAAYVVDNGAKLDTDIGYAPMTIRFNVDKTKLNAELKTLVESNPEFCLIYPVAVNDGSSFDHIIFGFDGQQEIEPTDPIIGGLDDSNFCADFDDTIYIPEEERIIK